MKEIVERALAPLSGLPMWGFTRSADLLTVQFGERMATEGAPRGAFGLEIACAWRLGDGAGTILVASGDLFTPADPEAEIETFDWDPAGASWWDVRFAELGRSDIFSSVSVSTFLADDFGGFNLVCTGGLELHVFPNSSPAPHVETDFWRLLHHGSTDPQVVVGSAGIELVHQS